MLFSPRGDEMWQGVAGCGRCGGMWWQAGGGGKQIEAAACK